MDKEWINVERSFLDLIYQHRYEEATSFISGLLKCTPIKLEFIPAILNLLQQKDIEAFNQELKPYFFFTASFLMQFTNTKEIPNQLFYHLFANEIYYRNFKESLTRMESLLDKNGEKYPLIITFCGILYFFHWHSITKGKLLSEKLKENQSNDVKLSLHYASEAIKYLTMSFTKFPNIDYILLPLLKVLRYKEKIDTCEEILFEFLKNNPLNPNSYILLGSFLIENRSEKITDIIQCYKQLIQLDPINNSAFSTLIQLYYVYREKKLEKVGKCQDSDLTLLSNQFGGMDCLYILNLFVNRLNFLRKDKSLWTMFFYFIKDHTVGSENLLRLEWDGKIKFIKSYFNATSDFSMDRELLTFKISVYYLLTEQLVYINNCLWLVKDAQYRNEILQVLKNQCGALLVEEDDKLTKMVQPGESELPKEISKNKKPDPISGDIYYNNQKEQPKTSSTPTLPNNLEIKSKI
ncbi:hypothetical protein DLAC_01088 [Tieghemostelium lacteum]|uniref:Uncharacterized protein n=1 Tax=Tieghemostelium lacteum TaxID=361077 RepID=A0A152A886_TIELA|nr:hypothetical protein DLAC_01088 [Tieghemostelium lacteum]|eukprot:KYR02257.1 hypothetical protein DLAC_01088 [Tieghemostelium lacteum]